MFNSKSKTSVDLSKKVDNVLNAFKTAIDGLKEVNASAELEMVHAGFAIEKMSEKEALENIRKKNEGVLAKLNAILE